jgi:hypothetical protein
VEISSSSRRLGRRQERGGYCGLAWIVSRRMLGRTSVPQNSFFGFLLVLVMVMLLVMVLLLMVVAVWVALEEATLERMRIQRENPPCCYRFPWWWQLPWKWFV